jgi:hypothetical protein
MTGAQKLFYLLLLVFVPGRLPAQELILDSNINRFLIDQKRDKPRLDVIVQRFTDYEKNVISKQAVMDTTTRPAFEKVSDTEYNVTASRMGEKLTVVIRNAEKLDQGYYVSCTPSDERSDSLIAMSRMQLVYKLNGEQTVATPSLPFLFQQGKIVLLNADKKILFKLNINFTYPKPQLIYVDITNGYGTRSWEDTAQIRKIVNRVNKVPTVYSQNNAVPDRIVTNYDNLFFRYKKAYYDGKLTETTLFCKMDDIFWTKTDLEMYPVFDVESVIEKGSWYILPSGEHTVKAGYIPGGGLATYKFTMNKRWDKLVVHYLLQAGYMTMMLLFLYPWVLCIPVGLILFAQWGNRLKRARDEAKKTNLELQAIQAQLNPHFIFNAMGSIQGLINKNEIEKANVYLTDFSKLLRNSLNNNEKEMVPLSEELGTLDSYVKLEKLRFNFQYTLYVDESIETSNVEIPALLIQPVIENAIKHGISGMGEKGELGVSFTRKSRDLVIEVRDNGKGFDVSQQSTGKGIRLTRERITLLNRSKKQKIEMEFKTDHGTRVTIILKHAF